MVIGRDGALESEPASSFINRILRGAGCPVMTVPTGVSPSHGQTTEEVLCPIDFGQPFMPAVQLALSIADASGANLAFLHLHDDGSADGTARQADAILHTAERVRADLIVMATRARLATDSPGPDSSARRVIDGALCPVVVVRR